MAKFFFKVFLNATPRRLHFNINLICAVILLSLWCLSSHAIPTQIVGASRTDIEWVNLYMEAWAKTLELIGYDYTNKPVIVHLVASPHWYTHLIHVHDLWTWFESLSHAYLADPQNFNTTQAAQELCQRVNSINKSFFALTGYKAVFIYRGYNLLFTLIAEGMKLVCPELYGLLSMHLHVTDLMLLALN